MLAVVGCTGAILVKMRKLKTCCSVAVWGFATVQQAFLADLHGTVDSACSYTSLLGELR